MLRWALFFLLVSLVAAIVGAGGVSTLLAAIVQALGCVLLAFLAVMLTAGLVTG